MKIDRINFDQMKFYSINPESVKTLVINLDRTPERYQKVKQQLDANNIKHQRFSAIDGYELRFIEQNTNKSFTGKQLKEKNLIFPGNKYVILSQEDQIYYSAKKFGGHGLLTAGEFGVFCSHRAIWQYMVSNHIEYTLILEDDVIFSSNYYDNFSSLLTKVPEKWDLIYLFTLDYNKKYIKLFNNPYLKKLEADRGSIASAAGYLVNLDSAKKLLELTKHFYKPIDLVLSDLINQKKIIAYKTIPDYLISSTGVNSSNSEIYNMGRDHY